MATTVAKGTAAELIARADVLERGFEVEVPSTHTSIHDFTVRGMRVQVKRAQVNEVTAKADIRRPSAKCEQYSPDEIDVFAIVHPETRRVAYIHVSELAYGRRLTFFLTRDHTRAGLSNEYKPLYFEDYEDISRLFTRKEAA